MKSLALLIVAVALAAQVLPAHAGDAGTRAYTAASNIIKSKPNAVTNSINNVR